MKTIRLNLSGTVQGVFFRKFLKEKADELNLRGFARNLENGSVEVVVEGKDENVNEMLGSCRKGHNHAEVKEVLIEELKHQGFEGFKILSL